MNNEQEKQLMIYSSPYNMGQIDTNWHISLKKKKKKIVHDFEIACISQTLRGIHIAQHHFFLLIRQQIKHLANSNPYVYVTGPTPIKL